MLKLAANLSLLYPEHEFLDRFAAAARDGFAGVEYLFPYAYSAADLRQRLQAEGLQQVLFNTPPGGQTLDEMNQAWVRGDRGTLCVPGRETEFRRGMEMALRYAEALDCPRIHAMVGLRARACSEAEMAHTALCNLEWAAALAEREGRTVLIEPINPINMPGFFLNRQDEAHRWVQTVGSAHAQVQMDLFHCQRVEGQEGTPVAQLIETWLPTGHVGHIQLADAPDRHEPGTGSIDWPAVFALLHDFARAGHWSGWVGCEYLPQDSSPGGSSRGLAWRDRFLPPEQALSTSPTST